MVEGKECTIQKLRRKLKNGKRLICFGAGGLLEETCICYPKDHLEEYIDVILDNNSTKWGTVKKIGEKDIPIKPPLVLSDMYRDNTILMITLRDSAAVLKQVNELLNEAECYVAPLVPQRGLRLRLIERVCSILPMQKAVLFNGWGDTQRENESTLRDYMIAHGYEKKYKFIWMCDDDPGRKDHYVEISRRTPETEVTLKEIFKYYYYINTSKYLICENHIAPKKRKKQIQIYLNHGTPPIKATKHTIILPSDVSHVVCSSPDISDIVSNQYSVDKSKLVYCGSPRFDHLFVKEKYIGRFFNCESMERMILWVPTFRQHNLIRSRIDSQKNFPFGIPIITKDDDFEILNAKLKKLKMGIVIKPHPLQNLGYVKVHNFSNIYLLTQEDMNKKQIGINSIMKDMDAIITDYSTIAFDYMLLDRPIAYTVDDMEDYSVGFSVENPLEWMPGEKIKDLDALLKFLEDVSNGQDSYKVERTVIRKRVHKYEEKDNCGRLLRMLNL